MLKWFARSQMFFLYFLYLDKNAVTDNDKFQKYCHLSQLKDMD